MKRGHLFYILVFLVGLWVGCARVGVPLRRSQPNIILILTDDQGFGDLGVHGNPKIKTPNIDRFAAESVEMEQFYVSPVCTPTRASLMTGRYNYRTCAIDTYMGRAIMHPDEVTLAEMLRPAGYRTGIFGKWHLGDNYPMRPMDQGFEESLVLKGGGIGQASDPPGGDHYFDPTLQHNGAAEKKTGYCSDIFTQAAMDFIGAHKRERFFVYLPFNCPHLPLEVPEAAVAPYRAMNLAPSEFPQMGHPPSPAVDADSIAKVYGMVSNIDDNVGRLLGRLDELHLAENTIVIFMTDNGPQTERFRCGLRGCKGSVYEGGIRAPFFIRWPAGFRGGRTVDQIAAHIDLAPTLLDACRVKSPSSVAFDGISLLPLLKGGAGNWPDRTLYFQWHRGDEPEKYRACAARTQRYKWEQPAGANGETLSGQRQFELYDLVADPYESRNLVAERPDLAEAFRRGYERWFEDVGSTRGYAPPRIHLGTPHENPAVLTRQDWRGPKAGLRRESVGFWEVDCAPGRYDISLLFPAAKERGVIHFKFGTMEMEQAVEPQSERVLLPGISLPGGPGRMEGWLTEGSKISGAQYLEITRLDP